MQREYIAIQNFLHQFNHTPGIVTRIAHAITLKKIKTVGHHCTIVLRVIKKGFLGRFLKGVQSKFSQGSKNYRLEKKQRRSDQSERLVPLGNHGGPIEDTLLKPPVHHRALSYRGRSFIGPTLCREASVPGPRFSSSWIGRFPHHSPRTN